MADLAILLSFLATLQAGHQTSCHWRLTEGLQKVSAQVELKKPASQVVNNP